MPTTTWTIPPIPPLVGTAEIADILGVSRSRAVQLTKRDDFPPVVQDLKATPLRLRSHIEQWATTWTRTNGRPRKKETDS